MAKLIDEKYFNGNKGSVCENSTGNKYFLATEYITLKNGEKTNIYFWLPLERSLSSGQSACLIPSGFSLAETAIGMPVLRKN